LWGGKSISAQTTVLSTQLRRDGLLNVILRYHENSLLDDERGANDSEETEPIASIILLEEVRLFEWRVLDQRTLEWQYQWDQRGRLPTQVEVVVAFGANGEELRRVFWIPAKENPESFMNGLQSSARSTQSSEPRIPDGTEEIQEGEGP